MRKILVFTLILVFSLSMVMTGCGSTATTGTEASASTVASSEAASTVAAAPALGTFPLVTKPTTIKIFTGWGKTDINKNWNTIDYEAKTGVHIDWQIVTSGDSREKRALVLASGDLPDAFVGGYDNFTTADEMQYGSSGSLIPLNKLIDTDSIYVKKILSNNELATKLITLADGNIYSLPTFATCFHCNYAQKMWVNADWLKKLNITMPKTTDEFEAMLKAFKEKDPNGNGKADEIPLTTTTDGWHFQLEGFLMNAFVFSDADTHLALNNGKIEMTAIKPEFKEGLKYLNKLYKEKLLSPLSFTTNASSMEKLNESGKDTVIGAVPGGANYIFAGGQAVSTKWRQYDILAPITGPSGVTSSPNYSATRDVITGVFSITKAAADPALIMRWVDWLYSDEGTLWHEAGREGTEWKKAEATDVGLNGQPAKYTLVKAPAADDNVIWEQFLPSNQSKEYRESWTSAQDWNNDLPGAPEVQLFKGSMAYAKVAPTNDQSMPNISVTSEKISDYTRTKTGIDDFIKESMAKFITGNIDIDKGWDSYVSKLESIGLKSYLDMCQQAYDAKFKK